MTESVNAVMCVECKSVIESKTVHDFVTCACGKTSVDGGPEYKRRIGNPLNRVEILSRLEFEIMRNAYLRKIDAMIKT